MSKFKAKRNRTIFRSNMFLLLNIFFFFFLKFLRGVLCVCAFLDSLAGLESWGRYKLERNGKVIDFFIFIYFCE